MILPNFLFLGPDKSGSTWLARVLSEHPDVFMPSSKELFFFDRYYSRGVNWYSSFYSGARQQLIRADISHDYLFSNDAPRRIATVLGSPKMMVTIREPVDRAHSSYLYMRKQGRTRLSFEDALVRIPELVDHGAYWSHLRRYLETFGPGSVHVGSFSHLAADPVGFAAQVFDYLGVSEDVGLTAIGDRALPAMRARSHWAARIARQTGVLVRGMGFPALVTRSKQSALVNRLLYAPFDSIPPVADTTRERLRAVFRPGVETLDAALGTRFTEEWGY